MSLLTFSSFTPMPATASPGCGDHFEVIMKIMIVFGVVIAISVLFGWIIKRLVSAEIRREFSGV